MLGKTGRVIPALTASLLFSALLAGCGSGDRESADADATAVTIPGLTARASPVAPVKPPAASPSAYPELGIDGKPVVRNAAYYRWHPTPPPPLAFANLPRRSGLPTRPLPVPEVLPPEKRSAAEKALRRGLVFYYKIGAKIEYPRFGRCVGWCGKYSEDLQYRGGENSQQLPPDTVKMQSCGTPQVLEAFLAAYLALGDPQVLEMVREGGNLLLAGQSPYGGWHYEMRLGPRRARGCHVWPGFNTWPADRPEPGTDNSTFDDGNTFAAAETLYRLWWVTKEQRYYEGWRRAMDYILRAQKAYGGGGYPQGFPSGGYHRYATFNDGVMRNCVSTLLRAYQRTGDRRYYASVVRCGEWLIKVRKPGQGWGAQHDAEGNVASARSFEPPGLEPPATSDAIGILVTIYNWTGDEKYLNGIQDAADWLKKVQLSPGRWARYYNPETNKPWYRNRAGQDVDRSGAKGGYTWEGSWGNKGIQLAASMKGKGRKAPRPAVRPGGDPSLDATLRLRSRPSEVQQLIQRQEPNGCWFGGKGARRRKGKKIFVSSTFVSSVNRLSAAVKAERAQK